MVGKVVKMFCSGGALGVEKMHSEFLKAMDVAGVSWLTCHCNIACQSRGSAT